MRKIVVTKKIRELLKELDEHFEKFGKQTEMLADRALDASAAVNIGTDREHQKRIILGCAWRINKASTGKKDS